MKKIIMLTIMGICAILCFVGCENGKKPGKTIEEGQQNIESQEENVAEHSVLQENEPEEIIVPEVYHYNESGKIIIAMYHKFTSGTESDEWTRSFDNFYQDLEYLYEHGYRSVSLHDYLNNEMKVPVGCTPIVFTFDDGSKGQFHLIEAEDGSLIADPESAVGVMERFYREHPDFGLNGTFFINGTGYFGSTGTRAQKLQYLIDKGFEIGNHTNTHVNFSKASIDEIQKEIGVVVKDVAENANGYVVDTLALPFGITSKEYADYIRSGEYEGTRYENKVVLLVGANPALPVSNEDVNLMRLPRVRARGGNKEVECDLYWWLERMEKNPEMKYYRLEN
ncbi:MAG: polysaccharide deacetylase family protein [Clostridia bacterium]|nr:polysaccharide deacetylase family protein [Clostridia bacterium]